jgi:hypothetical protein
VRDFRLYRLVQKLGNFSVGKRRKVKIQDVRMKCIQNKKFISRKLIVIRVSVYVIGKENSENSFFMPGLRAYASW